MSATITIDEAVLGECFSVDSGKLTIRWTLDYTEAQIPDRIVITTVPAAGAEFLYKVSYPEFENGVVIDANDLTFLPVTCTSSTSVDYNVEFFWTEGGVSSSHSDTVNVTIPCCYYDECGPGDGDGDVDCELCWSDDNANLKLWLDNYFEHPWEFTPGRTEGILTAFGDYPPEYIKDLDTTTPRSTTTFDIKYCAKDKCVLGVADFEVYLTLPEGVSIYIAERADSNYAVGVLVEESFVNGVFPNRWRIAGSYTTGTVPNPFEEPDYAGIPNTTQAIEGLSQGPINTLVRVQLSEPLRDRTIEISEGTTVEVIPPVTPITAPPVPDDSIVYGDDENITFGADPENTNSWQTGPNLSTCQTEVEEGIGDFHFSTKALDNSIFDVRYCLKEESVNSFVLACVMSDFKTQVAALDSEFGDAITKGWNIGFKNLSPGFCIIYGKGSRPIDPAGLNTLLRVYLSENILQRNPDGEETCVCIFPLFMNIGSLFSTVESYLANLNTSSSIATLDPEAVASTTATGYSPSSVSWSTATFNFDEAAVSSISTTLPETSGGGPIGTSATPGTPSSVNANFVPITGTYCATDLPESVNYAVGLQIGSGFLADLHTIAANIDDRFVPIVECITTAYESVITKYQSDREYTECLNNAIRTAQYFRIFFTIWTALIKSIPTLGDRLTNTTQAIEEACDTKIGVIFECDFSNNEIDPGDREVIIDGEAVLLGPKLICKITYETPLCAPTGVEIDFSNIQAIVDDLENYGLTLLNSESWTGDAKDRNYVQAYSNSSSKYIAAFGANLNPSSSAEQGLNKYLKTDASAGRRILTTLVFNINGKLAIDSDVWNCSTAPSFGRALGCSDPRTLEEQCEGDLTSVPQKMSIVELDDVERDWAVASAEYISTGITDIRNAIKADLASVKIVSNEKLEETTPQWTGNSFFPSNVDIIDVKDFLTTLMNVVEPDPFDLSEDNLGRVIKLPNSAGTKTIREFYNLNDADLTGVTYSPTGTDAYKDPDGNYMLPVIDANADGKIDIVDLIALRNIWLSTQTYPFRAGETFNTKIVPTNCCFSLDSDVEIFIPDNCSNFCIQPPCYAKVWLSDLLVTKDRNGQPDKYYFEVSYAVNPGDEIVEEISYPVQDISGIQFKISGLKESGITCSLNGTGTQEGKDATAVKANEWREHFLSSNGITKDTYITYANTSKYINKGKGVLCYFIVEPSSIPDAVEYLDSRLKEEFVVTNKPIKFETSPEVTGVANVSSSRVAYSLANLRFDSHHTDELLIFERFGIRLEDYRITTNRAYLGSKETGFLHAPLTTEPVVTWTGDPLGDGIDEADLRQVLSLAATKGYDEEYDSNGTGEIDIVDVQTIAHSLNNDFLGYENNLVPRYACPRLSLQKPFLQTVDVYSIGPLLSPRPTIIHMNKDGTYNSTFAFVNDFLCDFVSARDFVATGLPPQTLPESRFPGGVLVYWDKLDYADYYIVYRKKKGLPDSEAIPIIAASQDGRNLYADYLFPDKSLEKKPLELLPNMWVDYPPTEENQCRQLDEFCPNLFDVDIDAVRTKLEELFPDATIPGKGCLPPVADSFIYWVVAINRQEETTSDFSDADIPICNYEPFSQDITIQTQANTPVESNFVAYHPFASRPLGEFNKRSFPEAYPMWFFAQSSIEGDGKNGRTNFGGRVLTESKLPDKKDVCGKDQTGFTYTPKQGFVGRDTFKYVSLIMNMNNKFRPSTWCRSIATVTVDVSPLPPTLLARPGSNIIPIEKDKAFLSWSGVQGATSYRLYKNASPTPFATVVAERDKTTKYKYTDNSPLLPTCPAPGTPVQNTYEITSVYTGEDGLELESEKNSVVITFVCPADIDTPAGLTVNAAGFNIPLSGNNLSRGTVTLAWTLETNAENYNVYKRNSVGPGDWRFIGNTTSNTFRDTFSSCNDCSPASQDFDYYVTAVAQGFETVAEGNTTSISIPCYDDFVPLVSDKELTINERTELSSFVTARAVQGTISTYTLITPPGSDEGTLTFNPDGTFVFTPALNFTGTTQFEWQAQDSCGNTSNALFTINVAEVITDDEADYVIQSVARTTEQQDWSQVRRKNVKTSQVPFMLNNKGPSSLRRRCFAFSVTRGIDPFEFAPGVDSCRFPADANVDTCLAPIVGYGIIGTSDVGECS